MSCLIMPKNVYNLHKKNLHENEFYDTDLYEPDCDKDDK